MPHLVIVESPTKAKTISRFLGKEYIVESSFGHVRDLPKNTMGVATDDGFTPEYTVAKDKQKKVTELKKLAKNASRIYFATDEDREGEAISWHLQQLFQSPDEKNYRIVFHEITKDAILDSLKQPRKIDLDLVHAQQARRILDRLVGYELSPLLWKKVARGLSAGRVQSVAVRLIVEREREIEAFTAEEYWNIEAIIQNQHGTFTAKVMRERGKSLGKMGITNQQQADAIVTAINTATLTITDISTKEVNKNPYPPFITSTLQQAANSVFGFSAKKTMVVAQQLYEGIKLGASGETGLITYMRTDSVTLSEKFQQQASQVITKDYGQSYIATRQFKTKSKNAQEAHEAIRPTIPANTPKLIEQYLTKDQFKLYTLIWQRALASQMASAKLLKTSVDIDAAEYGLRSTGSQIQFNGWLAVYPADKTTETILPPITAQDQLTLVSVTPTQHFTQPPARYTEASLVKTLEELEIGRPSTYAPTISTIENRNYVTKDGKSLHPTDIGKVVNDLLVAHFPKIVDYEFTAKVENDFDEISNGKLNWQTMLEQFYQPFHTHLEQKEQEINKEDVTGKRELGIDPKTNKPISVRIGRYGPFVQRGTKDDEEKPTFAALQKDQSIETITLEQALQLLELPRVVYTDDQGTDIVANIGRFGPYLKRDKKFISLGDVDPYTVDTTTAKQIIAEYDKKEAEKIIHHFIKSGIIVQHGRYGPYITDGTKNAKIPKDTEPKELTEEQCKTLLAAAPAKKTRAKRTRSTAKATRKKS